MAPRGKKPSWGSFVPQSLGYELCRQMADLIVSDAEIPYADDATREHLAGLRADLGPLLRETWGVRSEEGRLLWWTFAGGAINQALKAGLLLQESGWMVAADNFKLRIEADEVPEGRLRDRLAALADSSFWDDPEIHRRLLASLPEYRLSKFQRALPLRFSLEMIRDHVLDIPVAISFLRRLAPGVCGA